MTRRIVILGTGDHARVLADGCKRAVMIGPDEEDEIRDKDDLALGLGGELIKRRLVEKYGIDRFVGFMHSSAVISDSVGFGEGVQFMAGVVVQRGADIGDFVLVNTGAQIDHGCRIGDFAFIAPGAVLLGSVTVEEGAFVGANATVLGGRTIGASAIVGAGAVVTRDVDPKAIVVGNPAKLLRMKRDDE